MSKNKGRILVVDDDANLLKAIALRLTMWGYEVVTALNGVEALILAKSKLPDLIISDVWMSTGSGFSFAFRLKQYAERIPIIFLSASKQQNLRDMAKEFDTVAFLEKPYEPDVLLETITHVLQARSSATLKCN